MMKTKKDSPIAGHKISHYRSALIPDQTGNIQRSQQADLEKIVSGVTLSIHTCHRGREGQGYTKNHFVL